MVDYKFIIFSINKKERKEEDGDQKKEEKHLPHDLQPHSLPRSGFSSSQLPATMLIRPGTVTYMHIFGYIVV